MHLESPTWPSLLQALVERRDLDAGQMRWVMEEMMQGRAGEAESAAFLMGLRAKGETGAEIAEAARVLRTHMRRWDPGRDDVLDTCGTGGDGSATFNISTATAFVVAAAGVPVVKHGNRSVSSKSGSADALAALGVSIERACERAAQTLADCNLAFCFAPHFHPALKNVAALRKKLGIATLFNCLGPLANPAGARRQLLGVGRPSLLELLATALAELDAERVLLVHGEGGLDEVSLSGPTQVREVRRGKIQSRVWQPRDFGLAPAAMEEVRVEDAEQSAGLILRVLRNEEGPALRLVLANAAAALLAADKAPDLLTGVEMARQAIASGQAMIVLERMRTC